MDKLLWLDLNWNLVIFLITVVASIAIFWKFSRVLGSLLVSLVLYLGVEWQLWSWVPAVFWTVWIIALVTLIVVVLTDGGVKVSRVFAGLAVFIVATAFVFNSTLAASDAFQNWLNDDDAPSVEADDKDKNVVDESNCEGNFVDGVCKATTVVSELNLSDKDAERFAKSIADVYKGFEADELEIGVDEIPENPHERANVAYTKETIETREDLMAFFKSDNELAADATARVKANLKKAGWTKEQINDALTNPGRWVYIAPNVDHALYGTTFPTTATEDGVFKVKGARGVAAKDAIWYPVGDDGRIVKGAAVRADCGNPEIDKITPVNPDNPPPPVTCVRNCTPPEECPPGTGSYEDRCVKDSSDDGVGGNDSPASQPVSENPQGSTPGTDEEPSPPKPGPKPVDNSPAPDPNDGGYDSGSGNGSGTPGGSTCNSSGCDGGGPKPADPGDPPVVDDGTHSGDPGGF